MSTNVLEDLPGKLDINRHLPNIIFLVHFNILFLVHFSTLKATAITGRKV